MSLLSFFLKLTPIRLFHSHHATEVTLVKVITKSSRQFSTLILLDQLTTSVRVDHFLLETLSSVGFSHSFLLTSLYTSQHPLLVPPQVSNLLTLECPKLSHLFFSSYIHSLGDLINLMALNIVHILTNPKFLSISGLSTELQIGITNCLLNIATDRHLKCIMSKTEHLIFPSKTARP